MDHNETDYQEESLGALFTRHRLERALDIADIVEETRIPPKTILAIEADDFSEMPAPPFSKGFYGLYARLLGLDQEHIVQRFGREVEPRLSSECIKRMTPPSITQKQVSTLAARSTVTVGSIIGFSILLIILLFGSISWYLGYNPATHVSRWLRSTYQEPPLEVGVSQPPDFNTPASPLPAPQSTAAVAGVNQSVADHPEFPTDAVPEIPTEVKYQLVAEFPQATKLSIGVDQEETSVVELPAGTIKSWNAKTSLVLELPADSGARLYLNGIAVPLPETASETISIAIPEYLLD